MTEVSSFTNLMGADSETFLKKVSMMIVVKSNIATIILHLLPDLAYP